MDQNFEKQFSPEFMRCWVFWDLVHPMALPFIENWSADDEFGLFCAGGEI